MAERLSPTTREYASLAIIAGNGTLPLEVARVAKLRGCTVVAIAHSEETSQEIATLVDRCHWIKFGQVGKMLSILSREHVESATFAGGIRRVKLFKGVSLDMKALALLTRIGSMKDDNVLRGIAEEIEKLGVAVVGAHTFLDKSVPQQVGYLTTREFSHEERRDGSVGLEVALLTGRLDIGQTVVAFDGVITAVEAVEGTDSAIKRAGELVHKRGGVVVKRCKPHQDQRFDLPTIGITTVHTMQQSGLTALVLEAGRCIILDPQEVVREANSAGISIRIVHSTETAL